MEGDAVILSLVMRLSRIASKEASPLVHASKGFQYVPDSASKVISPTETAAGFPPPYTLYV